MAQIDEPDESAKQQHAEAAPDTTAPDIPAFQGELQGVLFALATNSPDTLARLNEVGRTYQSLCADHPTLIESTINTALQSSLGELSDEQRENMDLWAGLGATTEAGPLYERLLTLQEPSTEQRIRLGGIQRRIAVPLAEEGKSDEAGPYFTHSEQNLRQAIDDLTSNPDPALLSKAQYEMTFMMFSNPQFTAHSLAVERGEKKYDQDTFKTFATAKTAEAIDLLGKCFRGAIEAGRFNNAQQTKNRIIILRRDLGIISLDEAQREFENIINQVGILKRRVVHVGDDDEKLRCSMTILNTEKRLLENAILEESHEDAVALFKRITTNEIFEEWIGGEALAHAWKSALEKAIVRITPDE